MFNNELILWWNSVTELLVNLKEWNYGKLQLNEIEIDL